MQLSGVINSDKIYCNKVEGFDTVDFYFVVSPTFESGFYLLMSIPLSDNISSYTRMNPSQGKKRELDEVYESQLTEDQIEQMHVKGKLKKYSRLTESGQTSSTQGLTTGSDGQHLNSGEYSDDSDSDEDILMSDGKLFPIF